MDFITELNRREEESRTRSMNLRGVAVFMLHAHLFHDNSIVDAYWCDDPRGVEVRLIEVSVSVGNCGQIMPFRFAEAPDCGLLFPLALVLICPAEVWKIRSGELKLPAEWGKMEQLYVPKHRDGTMLFSWHDAKD